MHNSTGRLRVNGKLLSVKQTEKFNFFMENSPTFRDKFVKLATESGISTKIEVK